MKNILKAGMEKREDLAIASIFGKLKTNIDFSFVDKQRKILVFTSSLPNEGKTTISVNTAVAMAASDKKTLLIDADMRNPSIHLLFNCSNSRGLSDIINMNMDWRQFIIKPQMPNLYVITAGRKPSNPAKFLSSERFSNLLLDLSKEFDVIILDTPPVLLVPDSQIVSALADGAILVVKNGKTTIKALKETLVTLQRASVNLIGAVLNEVRTKDSLYGYGAGYTYGADISKRVVRRTRAYSSTPSEQKKSVKQSTASVKTHSNLGSPTKTSTKKK